MPLTLRVPPFGDAASPHIVLLRWHGAEGLQLEPGAPLADLRVDLSRGMAFDCPPISTCRLILQETAVLERRLVQPGDSLRTGQSIAELGGPDRVARVAMATIIDNQPWWLDAP